MAFSIITCYGNINGFFSPEHYVGIRLGLHVPSLVWDDLSHSGHRLGLVGKNL